MKTVTVSQELLLDSMIRMMVSGVIVVPHMMLTLTRIVAFEEGMQCIIYSMTSVPALGRA